MKQLFNNSIEYKIVPINDIITLEDKRELIHLNDINKSTWSAIISKDHIGFILNNVLQEYNDLKSIYKNIINFSVYGILTRESDFDTFYNLSRFIKTNSLKVILKTLYNS